MPSLLKRFLKSLPALGIGLIGWMTQVSPDDAESNLAKWYGKLGAPPSWLVPHSRDLWATILLSIVCVGLLFWIWRKDKYLPLPKAAEIAYERGRQTDSVWAHEADKHRRDKGGGPDLALDFMAGIIAGLVPLYGQHPPSKKLEEVGNLTKHRPMVFGNGGEVGRFVAGRDGTFEGLSIRARDLKVVIENIENGLKTTTKI